MVRSPAKALLRRVVKILSQRALPLCLVVFGLPLEVLAHGGGLDASGCHTNRKTGDYHCHRNNNAATSQGKQVVPGKAPQNQPGGPTCYTGPRGGTYTITPSGRKNYKGC